MSLILSVLLIFLLLVGNEIWWRRRGRHGELSRKFIHITVGSFVAFWPYFMDRPQILLLSGAFLVVVTISRYMGLFKAIHSVQRPTWGEMFFALAVAATAIATNRPWLYAVALLHMSLADGLAAVVGLRLGWRRYTVFGHTKSLTGTGMFFLASVWLLLIFAGVNHLSLPLSAVLAVAAGATLLENAGGPGIDNLTVPLFVALVLERLT